MAGRMESEARRAAALRENLKRRKRQVREREGAPQSGGNSALEPPEAPDRRGSPADLAGALGFPG